MKKVALFLFNETDAMPMPWLESGYECVSVDISFPEGETIINGMRCIGADINEWIPPRDIVERVVFVAAFPPCDHLAVSGARWFKGKGLGKLSESIMLFHKAAQWCEWFNVPYFIENPVSTISSYWRKPDFIFHPWEYAGWNEDDNYTKKTCIWTGGGFVMPEKLPGIHEPDDRIHKAPPGSGRKAFRSATPLGFSIAVFKANNCDANVINIQSSLSV